MSDALSALSWHLRSTLAAAHLRLSHYSPAALLGLAVYLVLGLVGIVILLRRAYFQFLAGSSQASHDVSSDTDVSEGDMEGVGLFALEREKRRKGKGKEQDVDDDVDFSKYTYPGLLNTSTTCYLNSTLQSLASLPSFQNYLTTLLDSSSSIHLDLSKTLVGLLNALNTPTKSARYLRTTDVLAALTSTGSSHSTPASSVAARNRRRIIQGSGQQDAQEFFLILTEAVEEEKELLYNELIVKEREKQRGWRELLLDKERLRELTRLGSDEELKNPFSATMAHRTSCMTCGYTEAIRHLPTEHLTLNVPAVRSCALEEILQDYTKLELIDEFTCRRCSVLATHGRMTDTLAATKEEDDASVSAATSKKRRLKGRETRAFVNLLDSAIKAQDYERDFTIPGSTIQLHRSAGPASKQVMYARPPKALVIHLGRSSFGGYGYGQKNNCHVNFPEYLNLDPYTTTTTLSTNPSGPISPQSPKSTATHFYRLHSLVVHFGSHSYGHYVSYRRAPAAKGKKAREEWFRISDETVELANWREVEKANPFLLFYEKVDGCTKVEQHHGVLRPAGRVQESWELVK